MDIVEKRRVEGRRRSVSSKLFGGGGGRDVRDERLAPVVQVKMTSVGGEGKGTGAGARNAADEKNRKQSKMQREGERNRREEVGERWGRRRIRTKAEF